MEEPWLIINDQLPIEAKAAWPNGRRNGNLYPVYIVYISPAKMLIKRTACTTLLVRASHTQLFVLSFYLVKLPVRCHGRDDVFGRHIEVILILTVDA